MSYALLSATTLKTELLVPNIADVSLKLIFYTILIATKS